MKKEQPPEKPKRDRAWSPTPIDMEKIEEASGRGLTLNQIAAMLGVSLRTFSTVREKDEQVEDAFQRGRARAVAAVSGELFKMATEGPSSPQKVRAQEIFLKLIGGMRDHEPAQTKVSTTVNQAPSALSAEALAKVAATYLRSKETTITVTPIQPKAIAQDKEEDDA